MSAWRLDDDLGVLAAVGNVARMTRPEGFSASSDDPVMIGQIHLCEVPDLAAAQKTLEANFAKLTKMAEDIQPRLIARGGGLRGMEVRRLVYDEPGEAAENTLVFNFFMDCRDAMGANMINTTAEHLAPEIEALTQAKVGIKILSNLADRRLVRASVSIPVDRLATASLDGMQVAQAIAAAYRFAYADPYRACTHNKGVMNGIDPIVIATGNDWRAIEAGAHAYAARDGRYKPLASWKVAGDILNGHIALPMQVGVVGGTIKNHPTGDRCACMPCLESRIGMSQPPCLRFWTGPAVATATANLRRPQRAELYLATATCCSHPSHCPLDTDTEAPATAKAALAILDIGGAQELGHVIAAVGLAQNLAALRALATEGIQRGHMSMHARSLVARVLPDASDDMRSRVLAELIRTKDVKEAKALEIFHALSSGRG